MPSRAYAVVVGLDSITGLQTARILARRGVPVLGLAKDRTHFACRTRVCRRIVTADAASEQLIDVLEQLGPGLDEKAVLFPCTDLGVLQISRHRGRLDRWFHVALPPHRIVEMLMDKVSFCAYAQEARLPIPRTLFLRTRDDAEEAAETLSFPAILKPSLRSAAWDEHSSEKAIKVSDARELLDVYDRAGEWTEVVLAQEWVPGGEGNLFSCNCYFDSDGRPLVTFVARKIRQWRPQTGISSLGEEVRNDVVLHETVRLFEGVRFHGLGYVEMKRHEHTGEHVIIEPNVGRPTGRSAIAEAGGVELLYTKYCDVVGLPLPANRQQRYRGAKWIYLRNDLQSAAYYWRRGELTLSDWWRSVRGCRMDAVLSLRDPAPFVFDVWRAARLLTGRRATKRDSGAGAHRVERRGAAAH
jgi:D-aspartate ligase